MSIYFIWIQRMRTVAITGKPEFCFEIKNSFVSQKIDQNGFFVRQEDDARRNVEEEPTRPQPRNERSRPRKGQNGAAGEENHRGYQENGQTGPDGRREDHGEGKSINQSISQSYNGINCRSYSHRI